MARNYVLRVQAPPESIRLVAEAGALAFSGGAATLDVVASPLGTISDLSATAGVESAVLAWTPAANATSHQPQYREGSEGTWLDFGSALGGSASGVTVTGLEAVSHQLRVIAGDGSTTTTSNVDTATPTEPSEWPNNEPTGEGWETIFHADGTSKAYGGLATESDVAVVTDVDAPNGQAVEWRWPNPSPPGAAEGYFVNNFNGAGTLADIGPVREIYYRLVMRWGPNWQGNGGGDKLMYFGHVGRSSGYFLALRGQKANGMQSVTFQNQAPNTGPSSFFFLDNDAGVVPLDEGYVTIEVHMVAQSSASASDGEMHVRVNGEPISLQLWDESPLSGTEMRWVTSGDVRFEGFEWWPYWGGDTGTKTVSPYDWCRFGELYISGKA